jgi:uncharacterized protein involved in exopolysaccharide biosynthesis
MNDLKFYLIIFLRRLNIFLPVVMVISAASVIVAVSLPPAYESEMQLVVESPQIPTNLASSTVRISPQEQLALVRQRLLTRANMLDIARRLEVISGSAGMSPDQIVAAMRARTNIRTSSSRDAATLMWVKFEASDARIAAAVLGEYLSLIQSEDAQFRQERAGETLDFFEGQVTELGLELDSTSAQILSYKNENRDALPETLDFRLGRLSQLQASLSGFERESASLRDQRDRLVAVFEATGNSTTSGLPQRSSEEIQLAQLQSELQQALSVFSEQSVKVRLLRVQIEQLEKSIGDRIAENQGETSGESETSEVQYPLTLQFQLEDIDKRLEEIVAQSSLARQQIESLTASIDRTPEVSIALEDLNRRYASVQSQYEAAQSRLAAAKTGELIETRSRGQEISVIEPPAVPNEPTKPNRMLIASGGVAFGLAVGLGLVLLLELMNGSARRPEDLVRRFNIMPIATIPLVQTPGQVLASRARRIAIALLIIIGVPAAVWAVHTYYIPLDLLAEKAMNKIGVRF